MSNQVKLSARPRSEAGRNAVSLVWARGAVPAVIYGAKDVATNLEVEKRDIENLLARAVSENILVQLRKGPRKVGDLASNFELGRPAVSEHLQVLRRAQLVREEPRGRERYYHLDPRPLTEVESWIGAFERYWKQRLGDLEQLLDEEDSR